MAFPVSPTNGQLYSDGTYTYQYNSILRTWTKVNQTVSNVGNVVTTSNTVTTGNTTVASNTITLGTTTISNSNVTVGNSTITGNTISVGTTTLSNSNITVGNTVVSSNTVTVGNATITSNQISVGNTTVSTSNITVGNSVVSSNTISVGTSTITQSNISVGNSTITQNTISVGNTTLSNSNISLGNTTVTNSNITVGNATITSNTITVATVTANIASGNTSIVPVANGNVAISVAGTSNVLVVANTGTAITGNANVTGNISVIGNATVGNVSAGDGFFSNSVTINDGVIQVNGANGGIFNTAVTDINFGLVSNITLGSTTGLVTVRNNLDVANVLDAPSITVGDLYSRRNSVPVTNNTTIDTFPAAYFRSAKYTLRVGDDTGYQAIEVLLVHNNINSIITVYGSLSMTGTDLVTLTTAVNGANVELYATGLNANTTVNLLGTYVPD